MRHLFIAATATVAMLASCTSEVIPERPVREEAPSPIEFSSNTGYMTRATTGGSDAASLLGNQFNVFGVKFVESAQSEENPTGMIEVFNNTKVSFSNNVWDYTSASEETRYWDPNASKYNFFAYSDANNPKVVVPPTTANWPATVTIGSTTKNVTIEQLQKVYVAKGLLVSPGEFNSSVKFQFMNAAAKVRIAFYNAIPGYDVMIDNFYTTVNGEAAGNKDAMLLGTFYETAAYTIDLDKSVNTMTSITGTPTTTNSITLGAKCADVKIGRTISLATFDKDNKGYTCVMPTNDQGAAFTLKIDYTLHSKHETIKRTSTVVIPANFAKWYANHAYTYFFKITDNDLHPITFSAEVLDFETNETITTIDAEQQVDITTFVAGSDVQTNDQYKVGDHIFVGLTNAGTNPTVEVAHSKTEIDGSSASVINDDDYETLYAIENGQYAGCYAFDAKQKETTTDGEGKPVEKFGPGYYVIRVTYKCNVPEHTDNHIAYKVVRVVE